MMDPLCSVVNCITLYWSNGEHLHIYYCSTTSLISWASQKFSNAMFASYEQVFFFINIEVVCLVVESKWVVHETRLISVILDSLCVFSCRYIHSTHLEYSCKRKHFYYVVVNVFQFGHFESNYLMLQLWQWYCCSWFALKEISRLDLISLLKVQW